MKKHLPISKLNLLFLVLLISSTNLWAIAPPTISSFSPTSGPVGTTVTISGTNFNTTAANNIVSFGAVRANVTTATSISLTVIVPAGATYQNISVIDITSGLTAYSAKPFIITFQGSNAFDSYSFARTNFSINSNPLGVSIADLDGDGKPDVAAVDASYNLITVLRNTSNVGTVSFAPKVDFPTASSPDKLVTGDLDGDGKPDMVVAYNSLSSISVLHNTSTAGSVSFASKVDYTTGSSLNAVYISDIDGDGKPDLVVTNNFSYNVYIFRNTSTVGSISFAAKVEFATGSGPNNVSVGDLDGDGKPDLVTANISSNTVSVLRNTSSSGTISFATKNDFNTGSSPRSVSIGDLDGDGKPDLAIANGFSTGSVSVLRNTSSIGSVSFAAKVDFIAGNGPSSISMGDLDGDEKPELAITNASSFTVSVFRNNSTIGTISFADKVDYSTGDYPNYLAIGDLDSDGKPDIVASNNGSGSVSVFRSTVLPVPTITSFTPATATSGETVTITGTNFSGATSVKFGGTGAYTYTVVSPTTITAIVNSGTTGSISVFVVGRGFASLPGFTYTIPPAPTISSFTPTAAKTGTTITITGTNFIGTTAVSFGGTPASSYTIASATSINAVVATGSSGALNVTTPGGTSTSSGFTYLLGQTITFPTIDAQTYGTSDFDPGATASSSLPVTYTSSNAAIATIVENKIHIVGKGSCTIYANQSGNNVYAAAQEVSKSLTVDARLLSTYGITASNKIYDGTTTATLSIGTLIGIIGTDAVTLIVGKGVFTDKNIGNGKTITATGYRLAGAAAANYVLYAQPSGLTANITPAPLTITGVSATNKTYNGSAVATLSGGTLSGKITSDVVTINPGTGVFSDKFVGNGKTVTASGYTIGGANAGNYTLSAQPSGLTANITAAPLTITGVVANNKVYDGTTSAILSSGNLNGIIGSEVVSLNLGSGVFATKNAGAGKPITASGYSLSGADAGNYSLSQPSGITATITPAPIAITDVSVNDKVYDGTITATLNAGKLNGVIDPDVVSLSANTLVFADKNVGTDKPVTASEYTLTGIDAGNYTLSAQPSGLTADITARPITISVNTGQSKKTGAADPNFTYSISNGALVAGETLTGALTRLSGESAGSYPIQIGTLTAGTNYNTSFITDNFTIMSGTGVVSILAEKPSVYPNPTNGLVSLDIQGGLMSVFDLNGKMVLEQTLGNNKTFDIGYLASGTYILILKTKDSTYNYKIVKQ